MSAKVLILSKNDRHHPLEELDSRIIDWTKTLDGIEMTSSHDKEVLASGRLDDYDICLLCITMGELTSEQENGVVDFVQGGKTLFGIHSATVVNAACEKYIDLIGGRFIHHSPFHEFQVNIKEKDHPITRGVEDFKITDELYVLDRAPKAAHILATALWEDKAQPLLYTKNYGQGKVLYNALGHNQTAYDHPAFKKLVTQGIQWTLNA